jgi:hypothetical protein
LNAQILPAIAPQYHRKQAGDAKMQPPARAQQYHHKLEEEMKNLNAKIDAATRGWVTVR